MGQSERKQLNPFTSVNPVYNALLPCEPKSSGYVWTGKLVTMYKFSYQDLLLIRPELMCLFLERFQIELDRGAWEWYLEFLQHRWMKNAKCTDLDILAFGYRRAIVDFGGPSREKG